MHALASEECENVDFEESEKWGKSDEQGSCKSHPIMVCFFCWDETARLMYMCFPSNGFLPMLFGT